MTRPGIVRADTIDLQDHTAPSAQDHKRITPETKLAPISTSLGPHQAETLRGVAVETAEENLRSPRLSYAGDSSEMQQYGQDLAADVANSINGGKTQQQDALAIAQNGGHPTDDGDLDDAEDVMDDDMMDKISSSPSIEDEDIDFEFVYALHTFVATVEGQANATKGDTMVLLDDSNSYWWLVRVVKDSSIGYLPAEHIETPTERLARLNKHRNIDLSATMLGDQAEKTKNPINIKSAMRRRKKTVTFAAPIIHDYSDYDYSSDDDDLGGESFAPQQDQQQQPLQQQPVEQTATSDLTDESARVEPLKPRSQARDIRSVEPDKVDVDTATNRTDSSRTSDEIFESKPEPSRSRNGTVRNTDSFFKDETIETKKITLTPNILRDDNEPRASTDSKELRSRPSLDKLEKELVKDDKKKKDKEKKDKEKKPSVIRNFFSRKDKKKQSEDEDESTGKPSIDMGRDSQDRITAEESQFGDASPERAAPQRYPSKLQKQQPRAESSLSRKLAGQTPDAPGMDLATFLSEDKKANPLAIPSTIKRVDPSSKAQSRLEADLESLDDDEEDEILEPVQEGPVGEPQKQRTALPGGYPSSHTSRAPPEAGEGTAPTGTDGHKDRLSESPVHVSPVNPTHPPALMVDTSSQEHSSPISSPSPELIEMEDEDSHQNPDSITTTISANTVATWNDANLRAFFDSGSDIRDLLVVVYDKSDVVPAGPDHPIASTLFKDQNAKLAEITNQLDNMLGDWLARKQRSRGAL